MLRIAVVAAALLVGGCSSSNSNEATTTSTIEVTTTVAETTTSPSTTTTTTTQPAEVSNCAGTEDELATTIGEPLGFFICDGDWASFMTKDYADTCSNCESITIAHRVNGAWKEVGDFNQNASLSPADLGNKISKESLCAIWMTNRSSQFVAETGCTPDS